VFLNAHTNLFKNELDLVLVIGWVNFSDMSSKKKLNNRIAVLERRVDMLSKDVAALRKRKTTLMRWALRIKNRTLKKE
jgi:hypothetical protein